MKELIRKILHERANQKKRPEDWENLSKEEKKVSFDKRFEKVVKLEPNIIDFMKLKFGEDVDVKTEIKRVWYGSDDFGGNVVQFDFYLKIKNSDDAIDIKYKIWDYIKNYFGINPSEYGSGMDLVFYKIKWERI